MSTTITDRDRAVLTAVAAGRCRISAGPGVRLTVDGLSCCDQFAAARLCDAGLIVAADHGETTARLTARGRSLLHPHLRLVEPVADPASALAA